MTGEPLDARWLRRHPLPRHPEGTDKNSRGHVVLVGGATRVPGGILLAAEAALRAGAGKVRVALPEPLAIPVGLAMPEIAVFPLPTSAEGEIDGAGPLPELVGRADCLAIGPAMTVPDAAGLLLDALLPVAEMPVILDAAAVAATAARLDRVAALPGGAVLTPHLGELGQLTGLDPDDIESRRDEVALDFARRLHAVLIVKGATTLIADPQGELMVYAGGGVGLATGGSGDVLTGVIAGLCARGLPLWEATCWGVWLHGEAGRRLAERLGPMGFLARELAGELPGLMRGV